MGIFDEKPKMRNILLSACFLIPTLVFTQVPVKLWDNTIGGTGTDALATAIPTADGGMLLAGVSNSGVGIDKTQPSVGGTDIWIVKLNSSGSIQWDRTIGTTTNFDNVGAAAQGLDGNYLIAGFSSAGISGDKTEASLGGYDYWLLKLDAFGNLIWQNTIGGNGDDRPTTVTPVVGGYIIGGYSDSGISGDKTLASFGSHDYWLFKINNTGAIIWQQVFGGSSFDQLVRTKQLADGSFLLVGDSYSSLSGNKTVEGNGNQDIWIVKLSGGGTVVWQKDIGGQGFDAVGDIVELTDGSFILTSRSTSNIGGDKSELSGNKWNDAGDGWWSDSSDEWLMRLTNTGEIIWEDTHPSSYEDYPRRIFQVADGRYFIGGDYFDGSHEEIMIKSINRDGFSIYSESVNGGVYWVYEGGDLVYDNGNTEFVDAFAYPDGTFAVTSTSDALIGDYKSEDCLSLFDYPDYWVIKFANDTCTLQPLYSDYDLDGKGGSLLSNTCMSSIGYTFSNDIDCDDMHSTISSTTIEICDGLDNDCNGLIDDGIIDCNPGPSKSWDRTFGTDSLESITDLCELLDGFVFVGSRSIYDIETPDQTGYDIIIKRINDEGNEIWAKDLVGSSWDYGAHVISTTDGNIIVASSSYSGIGGDKTVLNYGGIDCWLVKFSIAGDILWQKEIGGTSTDEVKSIINTDDGGMILLIRSTSGISGVKTENGYGSGDAWVVKLNEAGEIIWQNTIGGVSEDTPCSIIQTADGGYLIGTTSQSGIGGEKTVATYGFNDYWIIKLDSSGVIEWQKDFGGAGQEGLAGVVHNNVGEYLVFGNSASGVSAIKSEASISTDWWVLKLDNLGAIIWENTIQAEAFDLSVDVNVDPEGGYVLLGRTSSDIGFDKADPLIHVGYLPYLMEIPLAQNDFWIIKIDEDGAIEWQNNLGGNFQDEPQNLLVTSDGDIIAVGWSESYASGDKSEENHGDLIEIFYNDYYGWIAPIFRDRDGWMIYLNQSCDSLDEICNNLDDDCDGAIDDGVIESITISATGPTSFCPGGSVELVSDYTGAFLQWKRNGVVIPGAIEPSLNTSLKGSYTCVTSSDCGTAESLPLLVNKFKNPDATIVPGGPTTFCEGDSVILYATIGAGLAYQWFKDAIVIIGATDNQYTATIEGIYTCRVTKAATGCNKLSNTIIVTIPCRVGEKEANSELTVFPVPATNSVAIHGCEVNMPCLVFDALGQVVISQIAYSATMELNITELAVGTYLIRSGDLSVRFVKQ